MGRLRAVADRRKRLVLGQQYPQLDRKWNSRSLVRRGTTGVRRDGIHRHRSVADFRVRHTGGSAHRLLGVWSGHAWLTRAQLCCATGF